MKEEFLLLLSDLQKLINQVVLIDYTIIILVGDKMRRPNMREKDHIKNLCCLCTKLQMRTKNLEVRWCNDFDERMEYAKKIKPRYYDENNELLPKWQTENMYIGK